MCNNIQKLSKPKEIIGYKVAIKYKGRYYSPFTGIEYKVGSVPEMPKISEARKKIAKFILNWYNEYGFIMSGFIFHGDHLYEPNMSSNKLTALFISFKEADYVLNIWKQQKSDILRRGVKLVVLEINIIATHNGDYFSSFPVCLGSKILSIEEKI